MLPCKQLAAVSCAEGAHVRRSPCARRYGPASDAEFLRAIADKTPGRDDDARKRRHAYLKSYAFAAAKDDDGGGDKKASSIVGRARRAFVGSCSLHRRKSDSSRRRGDGAYGCRKAKYLVSLLLGRLRACTNPPPPRAAAGNSGD